MRGSEPPTITFPLRLQSCDMQHFKTKIVCHIPLLAPCEVYFKHIKIYLYYNRIERYRAMNEIFCRCRCFHPPFLAKSHSVIFYEPFKNTVSVFGWSSHPLFGELGELKFVHRNQGLEKRTIAAKKFISK